jgi:hypothetical protein
MDNYESAAPKGEGTKASLMGNRLVVSALF